MSEKKIPGKLVIVVVLMGALAALDLLALDLVDAGLEIALLVGVLVGNDGVRTFLRGLAVFQILWAAMWIIRATAIAAHPLLLVAALLGIVVPAYFLWALGRDDVREWMFRKAFHLDAGDEPPPGTM